MAEQIPVIDKKAGKRGFFRTVFNFNVRRWVAADEVANNTKTVVNAYRDILTKPEIQHRETFENAVQRLGFTEEKLQSQRKNFLYFSLFYAVLGVGLAIYSFYLFMNHGLFLAFFVSFVLFILMFCYAFKEHFWYMQISKRKLGCTFGEWFNFTFRGVRQ